jgi:hypothetical protein
VKHEITLTMRRPGWAERAWCRRLGLDSTPPSGGPMADPTPTETPAAAGDGAGPIGWVVLIDRATGETEVLDAYVHATPADAAGSMRVVGCGDGTGFGGETYRLAAIFPAVEIGPIDDA